MKAIRNKKDDVYSIFGKNTALIPIGKASKRPTLKGWNYLTYEDTIQDTIKPDYQTDLNAAAGIGVLLGPESGHLAAIDFDDENALADFEKLNPRLVDETTQTRGSRGRNFFVRIPDGLYPRLTLWKHKTALNEKGEPLHLGEFRTVTEKQQNGRFSACQTVVCGIHPDTKRPYQILNDAPPLEIRYTEIIWPDYFTAVAESPVKGRKEFLQLPLYAARREIAEEFLGAIQWLDDSHGQIECPHSSLHTNQYNNQEAEVFIDRVPTIHCYHTSCRNALRETNSEFRRCMFNELAVELPNRFHGWDDASAQLYQQLAETRKLYIRGGQIIAVNGEQFTPPLKGSELVHYCDALGIQFAKRKRGDLVPVQPTESQGKMYLASLRKSTLPDIQRVVNAPFLYLSGEECLVANQGFNADTRSYVTSSPALGEIPLNEATKALLHLFETCTFTSEQDKSRAIAYLITPALVYGNFLSGSIPIVAVDANENGAGKGYFLKMVARIYNASVTLITPKGRGGVGSFEESFQGALIQGATFVQLDNLRERVDSEFLEAFLTADTEDTIGCRIPFREEIRVHPGDTIVSLTGNEVLMTGDLASRMLPIRLRKPIIGYKYPAFAEGDTLEHLRANQSYYLGCVHSVIRAWCDSGCPRAPEAEHRFRDWAEVTEWIVTKIFQLVSPTKGVALIAATKGDQIVAWMNTLGERLKAREEFGDCFGITDLIAISKNAEIPLPFFNSHHNDPETAAKVLGKQVGQKFEAERKALQIECGWVHRLLVKKMRDNRTERQCPVYVFSTSEYYN